jgi:hypothetical protein
MYLTIATIAADQTMRNRVAACAAEQGAPTPEHWAYDNAYQWAAAPEWAAKWESAAAAGNTNPGADPTVITDGDVLAVIQPMIRRSAG